MLNTPFSIGKKFINEDFIEMVSVVNMFGDWVFDCYEANAEALIKKINESEEVKIPKERTVAIGRLEDMSPDGLLSVYMQDDGDMCLMIAQSQPYPATATLEFCSPGSGGGKSPATHKALMALAYAMEQDNNDNACQMRNPEYVKKQRA